MSPPAPPLAIVGATIVELDPARVARADVVVRGDRIVAVGPEGTALAPGAADVIDATGCVVTPAFVVGHTHLYSALARGMPAPGVAPRTFVEILERVWWRLDKALDDESVSLSAIVGAIDAARCGASFVIDHHASPRAIDGSLDRVAEALDRVGLRGALCYETSDRDGAEAADAGVRENERFLARVRAGQSRHVGLVGAHAPFTLGDATLDKLRDLSERAAVGIHVHVAEDRTDVTDAVARGTTLAARLERLGVARAGSIVAHGVHLSGETMAALSDAGAWLVTNARSNMNNAVGLSAAAGRAVALGTDGIGADMIAEAQAHFLRHAEAADGLAGDAVRRLVGAQALAEVLQGRSPRAPRVAPGERADLAILAYDPPTPLAEENLLGHVLFGWTSAHVRDTIASGRVILRNRVMQTIDEREVMAKARTAAAALWRRMEA